MVKNRLRHRRLRELKQRQLTANSSENTVESGAISPDGRYLAYADLKGMHIKLIGTGETETIPQPEALRGGPVDWSIGSWFPDGTSFLANACPPGLQHSGVWRVSVIGGVPRKLRDDAWAWSVSPDGSSVAFTTNPVRSWLTVSVRHDREIWLMGPDGEQARKLYETDENSGFGNVQWSPAGQRLAYLRYHQAPDKFEFGIESRDLKGGLPTTMISGASLRDFRWLPDGRMIYSLAEPEPNRNSCNFWETQIDGRTGQPGGESRRLTDWAGFCMYDPTVTADGKRLAFRKLSEQGTVYVADLEAQGTRITTPSRLTLSEDRDYPTAWTTDSKAVLFYSLPSSSNGRSGIFKQALDQDAAEPIVTGSEDVEAPRVSPDGAWVLYLVYPKEQRPLTPAELMRVPITGGPPQLVLEAPLYGWHGCATRPATLCAIPEQTPDGKQLIFTAFDPVKGRGRELIRFDTDPTGDYNWALSPDGSRIAVLRRSEGRIHVLFLSGREPEDVVVKGRNLDFDPNWSADGKGFFVASPIPGGNALLHVDLRGNAHVLWEQKGSLMRWTTPSPDGRHLAIAGVARNGNIWMIDNF
jgi:Tol biopolymer transport system component